jgi:RimJ/RimL family protein N-acetyltransferase
MEEMQIRPATANDLETLYRFEQGVISAERPFDPTLKEDPVRYYDLNQMLIATHIHLIVATLKEQVIGCGYARIEKAEQFLRHAQHAYLGFMYTDPVYRGKGVNKRIIEELRHWAQRKNVRELRLEVYFQNTAAIKAYEKAGFIKHMILMRKGGE